MAKLTAARDRWAKMSGKAPSIMLCYEAGYDAFWLARFLKARGIECLVVDAASMQVNRRARRAKTDRIDVGMLLRALIAWSQGSPRLVGSPRSQCRRGGSPALASRARPLGP
jgi:transposase